VSTSTPTTPDDRTPAAADGAQRPDASDPPARDVVVGVDGSEVGLSAVRWAAREASARGAPLRIIHAADYLGEPPGPGAPPPELPHARRLTAIAYTAARHAAPGLTATTEVVPGDAIPALLRAGAASQLLVLGISTTGAADELVMAPIAQRVAARSPQPVVIVPRGPEAGAGRPVVAVLTGDPADDEAVTAFAEETARRGGRPLTFVETGREHARGEEEPGDLTVRHLSLPHAPGVDLLDVACPTPLLVLSTGHPGRFHRGLDGLHKWLLRHCTSPLALVPTAAADSGAAGASSG